MPAYAGMTIGGGLFDAGGFRGGAPRRGGDGRRLRRGLKWRCRNGVRHDSVRYDADKAAAIRGIRPPLVYF